MKRRMLIAFLAVLVMLPLDQAVESVVSAVEIAGVDAWLNAALDALQAVITLMIALGILAIVDDPRTRPLWLFDRSVVMRRRRAEQRAAAPARNA